MNRYAPAIAVAISGALVFQVTPCSAQEAPTAPPHAETPSKAREQTVEPSPEARQRYQRGLELFADSDYALALIEFKRAYELSPSYRILHNIGQVELQLNHYAKAVVALRRYLDEGGSEIPADRRARMERDIETASARTANVTITVDVPGAEVAIDDVPVGHSPMSAALLVDAGTRKISATHDGYIASSKTVVLAGQDRATVSLTLSRTNEVRSVTVVSPPTNYPAVIGWSATATFGVGAIITGVMAMSANSKLKDLSARRDVSKEELTDKASERATFSMTSDILAGATLVAAGAAIYFTIKGAPSAPEKTAPNTRVSFGPGRLTLTGTF